MCSSNWRSLFTSCCKTKNPDKNQPLGALAQHANHRDTHRLPCLVVAVGSVFCRKRESVRKRSFSRNPRRASCHNRLTAAFATPKKCASANAKVTSCKRV